MELHQLRCFVAAAEELHFGRAAQRLDMLPATFGRHIRLLEEELATRLFIRTTRNVALTKSGALLLAGVRPLLAEADQLAEKVRQSGRERTSVLRLGAIDSAAVGLVPQLLQDLRESAPGLRVELLEDKTIRLLPRLLSGRLDLALIRPPGQLPPDLEAEFLFHETVVVALPERHALASRQQLSILDLAQEPLIVPDRRSRPHSYDLTVKLFNDAGLTPHIAQIAEEKQTIVNLVAAQLGIALVPHWTARLATPGVRFIPVTAANGQLITRLPLAVVWPRGSTDPLRDQLLETLRRHQVSYSQDA